MWENEKMWKNFAFGLPLCSDNVDYYTQMGEKCGKSENRCGKWVRMCGK